MAVLSKYEGLLNEYKLLHAPSIVKIKQLETILFTFFKQYAYVLFTFWNNTRAKQAML